MYYEDCTKSIEKFRETHDNYDEVEPIMAELIRLGRVSLKCSPNKTLAVAYKYAKRIKEKVRDDVIKHILELKRAS